MHTQTNNPNVDDAAGPRAIGIVLIDDHPIVRHGLRELLEHEPEFCVCGEADGAEEGRRLIRQLRPSVAIVDLNMPDGDGMDLIREARAAGSALKLIVLSSKPAGTYARLAKDAGADGFVPKHRAVDHIVDVVRCVLTGKSCFLDTCGCETSHWFG